MTLLKTSRTSPSTTELIIIVSLMMSLTAFAIDAILPALHDISTDLVVVNANDRQLVISLIYFGMALGQLIFGPLSDHTGRKPAIIIGYLLFITGAIISGLATNFPMMLLGRSLQGIGVSAPRGLSLALVRDQYEGGKMARIISFATTVFILVPTIAPSIGQAILSFAGWRSIFVGFIIFGVVSVIWFIFRMPETLSKENRIPFSFQRIFRSVKEILKIHPTVGFTIVSGCVYGVFVGYINSSQQILQEQYALGDMFSLYFAIIALSLGLASFINGRLVMRMNMVKLVRWALSFQTGLACVFLIIATIFSGHPPLWMLIAFLMLFYFCTGVVFGNINSLAMQPLGHLAGIGSGIVGAFSTLLSMLFGTLIGRSYQGTVVPLVVGMTILTGVSLLVVRWVVRGTESQ